jgi:M6 family metalloprotease-like protein
LRNGALSALLSIAMGWLVAEPAHATAPPYRGPLPQILREARSDGLLTAAARASATDTTGFGTTSSIAGPPVGVWNVPVLYVSFPDEAPQYDVAGFQTLLFDTTGANPDGSLSEYYAEVSRGALRVQGQTFGWYELEQPRNFYAGSAFGMRRNATPMNIAGMVVEALQHADAEVDFSKYDRDGDGIVDVVLIAHTGIGAEFSPSDATRFWSISSSLASGWAGTQSFVTNDPVPGGINQTMRVDRFAIVPELSGVRLNERSEIGVYCHEFGHALGWPDLYDASVLGGGLNLGPANWCLMATGLYGGGSLTPERPTRPCAWALADAGWITVNNLTQSGPVSFEPVDDAGVAYRFWWEGQPSSEYFLLENRRRRGTDADLPGEGLLVYRVEADIIAASRAANRVNSGFYPGLRVEEADGLYHLLSSQNRADAGDPFPGTAEKTEISDATLPSLRTYAGRYSNLTMTRIPGLPRIAEAHPFELSGSDLFLLYQDDADMGRVYALRRRFGAFWGAPVQVASPPNASDASWTASGPLTALWTDRRHGLPTVYYRSWLPTPGTEERAVHDLEAFAYRPAGAWVPGGLLHLVWIDSRLGHPALYNKRIRPGSAADSLDRPIWEPLATEEVLEFSLDASSGGQLYVSFTLRGPAGDEVFWTRFHPSSGWTEPERLSGLDGFPSGSPDVHVQRDGKVRIVWRDTGPTRTTVRSVVFDPALGEFEPTTDPLFISPLSLASVRFAGGPFTQDLLMARASESPSDRVLVGNRHTDGIWDAGLGWWTCRALCPSHPKRRCGRFRIPPPVRACSSPLPRASGGASPSTPPPADGSLCSIPPAAWRAGMGRMAQASPCHPVSTSTASRVHPERRAPARLYGFHDARVLCDPCARRGMRLRPAACHRSGGDVGGSRRPFHGCRRAGGLECRRHGGCIARHLR